MKEKVFTIRGTVFLVEYQHGHGSDHSIHKTKSGAENFVHNCIDEYRDSFVDKDSPYWDASSEELADSWWDITGGCEHFSIIESNIED
jgi:hypothetical protein